jgi:hypothetical protein
MHIDDAKITFLDIDGVLNTPSYIHKCRGMNIPQGSWIDPDAVKLLNGFTDFTGAKIVVSSGWRVPFVMQNNFIGMQKLLSNNGITADVIGMTPIEEDRESNIIKWIDGRNFKIVIIDDMDSEAFPTLKSKLVSTDTSVGLTSDHIIKCIQILNLA